MNKEYKVYGKGVLKYSNIESICQYGNKEDLTKVLEKVENAIEQNIDKIDTLEYGFDLLKVDYSDLSKKYKALVAVGATKKEIKEVIGNKTDKVKDLIGLYSYQDYLDNTKTRIEEAMG